MVDSIAKGYELDVSSLAVLIGIPRPTVHRWVKKLEEEGMLELIPDGHRKIIALKVINPKVVAFIDLLAENYGNKE